MKHNIVPTRLVHIAFAMAVVTMASSAYAQRCSLDGVAGKYGFSDSGTIVGVGARAAVGLLTFNAAGKVNGSVTSSLNGSISQTTLSGTYTVDPDCSGTASFTELDQNGNPVLTATVTAAWDDNMRQVRFVFTSIVLANGTPLAAAVNGEARKLAP